MIAWELLLFFGAPLLWGAWQLYSLRRDMQAAQRRDKRDAGQDDLMR